MAIVVPNLAMFGVGGSAIVLVDAEQLLQLSFGMHPAQRMLAKIELTVIFAEDDGFGEFSRFDQCSSK